MLTNFRYKVKDGQFFFLFSQIIWTFECEMILFWIAVWISILFLFLTNYFAQVHIILSSKLKQTQNFQFLGKIWASVETIALVITVAVTLFGLREGCVNFLYFWHFRFSCLILVTKQDEHIYSLQIMQTKQSQILHAITTTKFLSTQVNKIRIPISLRHSTLGIFL